MGFTPCSDFFKNVDVNVETCHDFITRQLKHYKVTDSFSYELKIEKAVWDILLGNKMWYEMHNKYGDIDTTGIMIINMDRGIAYRLFCLYNRFGKSRGINVRLNPAHQKILLGQLNIEPPESDDLSVFTKFLQYVHSCNDAFVTIAVKKAYDKYVRDIIREGMVTFQIKTISVKRCILRAKVGKDHNQFK